MERFIVMGGNPLVGRLAVNAAKNAVLPILSCCILSDEPVLIKDCKPISDVKRMTDIIEKMGGKALYTDDTVSVDCSSISSLAIDSELTKSIRSSIFMLGPLLGRFKRAVISYPGGCAIGSRPIDIHIDGLRKLGVVIEETSDYIVCDGKNMHSGVVKLSMPSVGATENLMMAAALTRGKTVVENAAREPEIRDLQRFINAMGGNVSGAGSSKIVIEGVERLRGGAYTPIGDRIVAGTYLVMCAACGGDITLDNVNSDDLKAVLNALKICGCRIEEKSGSLRLVSDGKPNPVPLLRTGPFPAFPTDMQPKFCALLATASGVSLLEENIFESRFKYVSQLENMGADIVVENRKALITGVNELHASVISAQDLRGGAALLTAALKADGVSTVYGTQYVDRGYYRIEQELTRLGADIVRATQ